MNSPRFGIIRVLPGGIPQWVQAAKDLAEAKAFVLNLASREPGEFFIYSEKNCVIVERFVCVERDEESEEATTVAPFQCPLFQYLS